MLCNVAIIVILIFFLVRLVMAPSTPRLGTARRARLVLRLVLRLGIDLRSRTRSLAAGGAWSTTSQFVLDIWTAYQVLQLGGL
jgi:hypothetical protein